MTAPVPVAHVITRLDVGGAQETVVRICAGLDRSRFHPTIYCGPDGGSGGSLAGRAHNAGVDVVVVPELRSAIRPWSDARGVLALASVLRSNDVGLVHTHSSKAGVLGRLAARRARISPVAHTVHGWSYNDDQPRVIAGAYRSVERAMAWWTDALVVVTIADRDQGLLDRIGSEDRYALVRSGIDLSASTTASRTDVRRRMDWADDVPVVISIGRLAPQKDPLALVEAFAKVRSEQPARLVLVGDGELRPAVEDLVNRRGLTADVELLGLRDDVTELLVGADAFVLSSRWEGLPRAVLEATHAGLPVVATDVGGVSEVLEDGVTGWLVSAGEQGALAAALRELLQDPSEAERRVAAARLRLPSFTEQAMVTDTEDLYASLLAGTGIPARLQSGRLVRT